MENELKKKYDEEKGIVITYDKRGRAFVSFPVSGVPLVQFDEWNQVCEAEFNSARWQKIYLDHKMNKATQDLISPQVTEVPKEQEEKKKKTVLLNGETIEDE